MAKNTGDLAQDEFEGFWETMGKSAHLHRFRDKKDAHGLNGRGVNTFKQPSDYLLTYDGITLYAEVKSTENPHRFEFSLIKPNQLGSAERITKASGQYDFFIRRLHPTLGGWFRVPASVVLGHHRRSMSWEELQDFTFPIPVNNVAPPVKAGRPRPKRIPA